MTFSELPDQPFGIDDVKVVDFPRMEHKYAVEAKYGDYLIIVGNAARWMNESRVEYKYIRGRFHFKEAADRTMFLLQLR